MPRAAKIPQRSRTDFEWFSDYHPKFFGDVGAKLPLRILGPGWWCEDNDCRERQFEGLKYYRTRSVKEKVAERGHILRTVLIPCVA